MTKRLGSAVKLRKLYLQTQRLRKNLIKRLSDLLEVSQREMERSDPATKPEWVRLIGYISSTLNAVMRSYDERCIDEELARLEELIQRAKEIEEKTQNQP